MMGASSHSEFAKVAYNWYYLLSKEDSRLNEPDRTVATSILAMMRSYEDMKTLRSMGFKNANKFWPALKTNLYYTASGEWRVAPGSDGYGFTSCTVKEQKSQSLFSKIALYYYTPSGQRRVAPGSDGYGFTSCTVKSHRD